MDQSNIWISDVLEDMIVFARENRLVQTEVELRRALVRAQAEQLQLTRVNMHGSSANVIVFPVADRACP